MPVAVNQILIFIGIDTASHRTIISEDLLPNPGKLENLIDDTEEGIKDACSAYNRAGDPSSRFKVSRTVVKRIISLMHWAKDQHRVNGVIQFPNGTSQRDILQEIADATVREQCRKTQKKAGESLVTNDFVTKLKNSAQWERWKVELKSTLSSIIGAKGVPLTYVIREDDAPEQDSSLTWDEKFELSVTLVGPEFNIDRKTVHLIILRNVAEDSDAYTYIKPKIRQEDGRVDMKALIKRYENKATQQERINDANNILDNLVYKHERAMSFELFSSKIQSAVDTLEECGRAPHDGDIVDKLWHKIMNTELNSFVEALKVQYNQNPRSYRLILQDIAAQIPNLKKTNFRRNVSAVKTYNGFTREGPCPIEGVFNANGKLFIGTYPRNRWFDEDVRAYHSKIRELRKKYPKGNPGSNNEGSYKQNRSKRKIKKLKAKIAELEKISNTQKDDKSDNTAASGNDEELADAGKAFGGRNAKKKVKFSKVVTYNRICKQIDVRGRTNETEVFVDPTEMDSHADTIVAGRNTLLLSYTDRVCEVSPYSDEYESIKDVPIVSAATGYTSANGENYILILNEALWMPNLNHSLLNPNQLRHNGLEVQDNPYSTDPMAIISHKDDFCACLESKGTTIYIMTWTPKTIDLEIYPHIHLSSNLEWNPQEVKFPSYSLSERSKIESRNIYSVQNRMIVDLKNVVCDGIHSGTVEFNLDGFNERIIAGIASETRKIIEIRSGPLNEQEMDVPRTFISSDRHSSITPEDLSEKWCISVHQAKMTLEATTRKLIRSALMPLSRRYRVDRMFGIRKLDYEISTDTIDGKVNSIHGERYAQVFGSKEFFVAVFPMENKSDAGDMLDKFVRQYGAPKLLKFDGSKEQCGKNSRFQQILRKYNISSHIVEPERPNQNPTESVIRELKRKWFRILYKTNCPARLWSYGLQHVAAIMNRTASNSGNLKGRTPLELITGETPDISEYLDFGFYDRVWFREHAGVGPTSLARFLGVSHTVGSLMSYWVMPKSGIPESRTTVQRVTKLEKEIDANKEKFIEYDTAIKNRFKENRLIPSKEVPDINEWEEIFHDDTEFMEEFMKIYDNPEVSESDEDFTPDSYDPHIGMELLMDRGGNQPELAYVRKRLKDNDGNPIGKENENPIMDSRMYEIEYEDGHRVPVAANVIVENLFHQVNDDGLKMMVLDQVIGHRTDGSELTDKDAFIVSSNGIKQRKETTKGHQVLLKWKDGTSTWNQLKDVKDSYPVQLADYAIENKLDKLPAFAWWIPYVIRKRDRIIKKLKSKYWSRTHKYGIRIPKTVAEAIEIDRENDNKLWWNAIMLEMKNVRPAFEVYEDDVKNLVGYQKIKCHFIFDVKLGENFRRKARLVGGGHTTDPPSSLTYSSVVSRDSVRILLLVAAINGLNILACDIQNAYLTAKCREKIYTIAGPEFGSEEGSVMIIKMALYGLKSSGAAFRAKLAKVIYELEYRPSLADPDVWMRPAVKQNGLKYYEYVLCYVDDVLVVSEEPEKTIDGLQQVFKLKGDKASIPDMYLGATLAIVETPNGNKCWSMSPEKYVRAAVENVEERLKSINKVLPSKCVTPTTYKYRPEEDLSEDLEEDELTYFQELIGVLRWAIEIGRADILLEVSLLSSHLASPRRGHLEQVYHIFGYLKKHPKRKIYLDPDHPAISESRFKRFDWEEFYMGAEEPMPNHVPEPRGGEISLHCFVDADHASDKVTRRSQTGIIIFGNKAPLVMYSKRQNSVQTSTFGSEFMAMRQAVEMVQALRYKIRQFGVPLDGEANMYCDNEAVYKNIVHPDSTIKKKHHSVAYHMCREAVASGMIRVAKEGTRTNIADLFTKPLSAPRREELLDLFMY